MKALCGFRFGSNHFVNSIAVEKRLNPVPSHRYRIESIEKNEKSLSIRWKDNHASKFHFIWLRDNCFCKRCLLPSSGQRIFNPADINVDIAPIAIMD